MSSKEHSVIVPTSMNPKPDKKELDVAYILADYFNADVKFVLRANYKTPDYLIKGTRWELKTPTGIGKHNIQHCIQDAAEQSPNIVIDGRQSKLHPIKLLHEVQFQFNLVKKAKRLLFIKKSGKVVEIFRNK